MEKEVKIMQIYFGGERASSPTALQSGAAETEIKAPSVGTQSNQRSSLQSLGYGRTLYFI